MKILSVIKKTMKISFIRKMNQPLVWLLRFVQRVFAPETCWEIAHCSIRYCFIHKSNDCFCFTKTGYEI